MAFDDVRLPEDIERGARGGPEFNTSVYPLSSGFEERNQNWQYALYKWDIGYDIRTVEEYQEVVAFFLARRGRARGFRFKDWSDYIAEDEPLVTVDSVTYLAKSYGTTNPYTRLIQKPVSGMITLSGSGSVDANTGIVTGASGGDTWSGEFDIPVRFDTDELVMTIDTVEIGAIPNIPVREIRL